MTSGEATEVGTIGDGTTRDPGARGPPRRGGRRQPGDRPRQRHGRPARPLPDRHARHRDDPAVSGLNAGEQLVSVSWRTQTGQLVGVGIDAAADTGTVYRIDPQTGAATAIGTPGSARVGRLRRRGRRPAGHRLGRGRRAQRRRAADRQRPDRAQRARPAVERRAGRRRPRRLRGQRDRHEPGPPADRPARRRDRADRAHLRLRVAGGAARRGHGHRLPPRAGQQLRAAVAGGTDSGTFQRAPRRGLPAARRWTSARSPRSTSRGARPTGTA